MSSIDVEKAKLSSHLIIYSASFGTNLFIIEVEDVMAQGPQRVFLAQPSILWPAIATLVGKSHRRFFSEANKSAPKHSV
jgi:hypothetical protein